MKLDQDLQAMVEKLELEQSNRRSKNHPHGFDDQERRLMHEALQASQQRRDAGDASGSSFGREIDFFVLCIGYTLLAFAAIVLLQWLAGGAAIGAPGAFGLTFLAAIAAAQFRAYYLDRHARRRLPMLIGSAAALLLATLALAAIPVAAAAIVGVILGAAFYRSILRRTTAPGEGSTSTA